MKKVFFLAATAALALSSCSENEITNNVENSRRTPISVSVYSKGQTRAVTDLQALQAEGFDLVIKATSADDAMFNDKCEYDGTAGAWKMGTEPLYWPLNEEEVVSFYALYCPAPAEGGTIEAAAQAGYTSTVYIDEDASSDIVAAYASSTLKDNGTNEMALSFSHLLSEIHFAIKGAEAGMVYTLNKITLTGAKVGTVTFAPTCTIAPAAIQENSTEYTAYDISVAGTAAVTYDATNGLTAAATPVGSVSLMLIPDTYEISVNYDVAIGADSQNFEKGGRIILNNDNAGKKTAATLNLPATLTPLSITATVADWADGTGVTPSLN